MKTDTLVYDESKRLEELWSLQLLDTEAEQDFDELVDLAALICGCPVSMISLIDEHRQWFKAKKGIELCETSRDVSFCAHAIRQEDVFIVENTLADKRFVSNPLVTGSVHIRFYAGAPIKSPKGFNIGTICVIDKRPKTLLQKQEDALRMLSRQASRLIELRIKNSLLNAFKGNEDDKRTELLKQIS